MTPVRTAFVTGATSGFGRAVARRLHHDGWRVIAAGRREDRLRELRDDLGETLLPWLLDMQDGAALSSLPSALPPEWRSIDLLLNNAGLALGLDRAPDADPVDWDRMIGVNVTGLVRLTRALLPSLVARAGSIINIGSTAGSYAYPGGSVYGASKAFVKQFSLGLRADLLGTGVRITNLEPGLSGGTEFSEVRFKGDRARSEGVYAATHPLRPEDIAETVAWLAGLPAHVNVNRLEMMPICQAPATLAVHRGSP